MVHGNLWMSDRAEHRGHWSLDRCPPYAERPAAFVGASKLASRLSQPVSNA